LVGSVRVMWTRGDFSRRDGLSMIFAGGIGRKRRCGNPREGIC
jgi:hypothetical protein